MQKSTDTAIAITSPANSGEIEIAGRKYAKPERLAEILDNSTRTLLRWHRQRKGPPRITIGKLILYPLDELPAWLAGHQIEPLRNPRSRRP